MLVAQHTFVSSDPWPDVKMVGAEVAEGDLLEAGKFQGFFGGEFCAS